jgi:hypothetical protein
VTFSSFLSWRPPWRENGARCQEIQLNTNDSCTEKLKNCCSNYIWSEGSHSEGGNSE